MSEWFFLQQMKRRQSEGKDKDEKLAAIRIRIQEALKDEAALKRQLDSIPKKQQIGHPIRLDWIAARTKYWGLIAEMRDIEHGKSVTSKEP